jgi:hypothetical protein
LKNIKCNVIKLVIEGQYIRIFVWSLTFSTPYIFLKRTWFLYVLSKYHGMFKIL